MNTFLNMVAGLLEFVGMLFGSTPDPKRPDYVGDQWGTHGHNGPFGQWTED